MDVYAEVHGSAPHCSTCITTAKVEGEKMAPLCAEYRITRKTCYRSTIAIKTGRRRFNDRRRRRISSWVPK